MNLLYNWSLWMVWGGLVIIAWLGDICVEKIVTLLPEKSLFRAIDTVLHGLIGIFSFWLSGIICPNLLVKWSNEHALIPSNLYNFLTNFGMPFIFGTIVDVDHVITDLIMIIKGLPRVPWVRGSLHNSLIPVVPATFLYIYSGFTQSLWSLRFATLLIDCFFNHHVRDGLHHGLNFNPLGNTPKLPYWLYLALTLFIIPLGTGILAIGILGAIGSTTPNRPWVTIV